jgi:hypothetical protein
MFSQYYDALVQGDLARANKIIWLPGRSGASNPVYPFQQNDMDKIDVDKYLMQVACWAFGNSPAEFGIIPGEGLGGKGFMQGSEAIQFRSMFWPITGYLYSLFNLIVRRYLKRPDLKFKWVGLDPVPDKLQMAQVDQLYIGMGAYSLGYVQDRLGVSQEFRPARAPEPAAPAFQPVNLPAQFQPYFTRAVKADLDIWRDKAVKALRKGWNLPEFESDVIPPEMIQKLQAALGKVQTAEQAAAVFENESSLLKQAVPQEAGGARSFFRTYP